MNYNYLLSSEMKRFAAKNLIEGTLSPSHACTMLYQANKAKLPSKKEMESKKELSDSSNS